MSLPKYAEYKDSGTAWIGHVPVHWEVAGMKRLLDIQNGADYKAVEQNEGFPVIGSGGQFTYASDYLYDGESVLLGRKGTIDKPLYFKGKFWTVDTMYWSKVLPIANGRFAYYASLTIPFGYYSTNTALPSMTKSALGTHLIAQPPIEEQAAIATFLDRETAKIDALIAEQEKLIALLAEKRQATISHAVTKGLNPNAAMKDSGVAWLGEVPAHWEITQLKRLCERITDGAHVSPETEGGSYSFISTKDLDDDAIDFEGCLLTSPSSYEYLERTGCKPSLGDVLFSKDGTIGRTVVVRDEREFVVASSLIIITPHARILDSDFLNYLCKSSAVSSQVERFVKGAGLPRLSIQNLLKVVGVFPPIEEQRSISAYLKAEIQKTDILRAEAEQAIALLKERRSALITAAVTGQIDVRELVEAQPS